MKNNKKVMAAALMIAAGYAGLASAHTQSGALGSKTSSAAATDVYRVTCYAPGTKLYLRVKDNAPVLSPAISIQATKNGFSTALLTDAVDGDANYSPTAAFAQGSGDYIMKVNKSNSGAKGAETYTAEFHCQDSSGNHTETIWTMTQNQ